MTNSSTLECSRRQFLFQTAAAALAGLSFGAESAERESPPVLADLFRGAQWGSTEMKSHIALAGDPSHGKVDSFRCPHFRPTMSSRLELLEIGDYHFEVLRKLLAVGYKDVFGEQFPWDYAPGSSYPGELAARAIESLDERKLTAVEAAAHVRERFSKGGALPAEIENRDRMLLAMIGAETVYACLNDSVTLRKTVSWEEYQKVLAAQPAFLEQCSKEGRLVTEHPFIFVEREKFALKWVAHFLTRPENAGKRVALIYGAAHSFGLEDLPPQAPQPRIEHFYIPGLLMEFELGDTSTNRGLFRRSEEVARQVDLQRQVELVNRAPFLDYAAFSKIRSEAGQLLAVERVVDPHSDDVLSPKQWELLKSFAVSEAVRQAIAEVAEPGSAGRN